MSQSVGGDNDVVLVEDASQMAVTSSLRFSVKIINPRTQLGGLRCINGKPRIIMTELCTEK